MFSDVFEYPVQKAKQLNQILRSEKSIWRKNLIIIALAQFLAMAGMSAIVPFLPLYIRTLGVTNPYEARIWSGIVFSGPYILSILSVPVWGVLGDKHGRKLMVIRAIIGLAVAMCLMGFAQNVWQLFLLRVFQGLASGFIAASLSFISANTPKERSGFAMGFLTSAQSAGNILGPLFGGIISDFIGIRPVFFITGILCFASAWLVIKFTIEEKSAQISEIKSSVSKNLKFVLSTVELRYIIIMIIIAQASIQLTNPVFLYFIEELNAPKTYLSTITGLMVGIIGVFSIIFAPYWGRRNDTKDYKKTITVSTLIIGLSLLAHTLATNYLMLIPLRILIGIFIGAVVPTLYAILSKNAPEDNIGGIMGIASSATLFGALISFLSSGFIASSFGLHGSFAFSGLLMMLIPVLIKSLKN